MGGDKENLDKFGRLENKIKRAKDCFALAFLLVYVKL
jgi:hypothetical protein